MICPIQGIQTTQGSGIWLRHGLLDRTVARGAIQGARDLAQAINWGTIWGGTIWGATPIGVVGKARLLCYGCHFG
jgi:hypothetical protein